MPKQTRLTNLHRDAIRKRLMEKTGAPRWATLRRREHALAVRMLRYRFGDDAFERFRALPEGWLPTNKRLQLDNVVYRDFPNRYPSHRYSFYNNSQGVLSSVDLADYAPLPDCAKDGWTIEVLGKKLIDDLHTLAADRAAFVEEMDRVSNQVTATLRAITTAERLAAEWPEGYAELPQETLAETGGLPALRVADLNARIAALKDAA